MATYPFPQSLYLATEVDDSDVVYPAEDGEPVAESDLQLIWLMYFVQALKDHFEEAQDIYAAGDMFIYFEKGNPSAVVAPDVFVVNGVENKIRETFKVWEEGKGPDFVIEITSKSTAVKDQTEKLGTYSFLGVEEYILFDPQQEYLDVPFKFYRWVDFGYKLITPDKLPDGTEVYRSETIGLEFHHLNGFVRMYDSVKRSFIQSYSEERRAREIALQANAEAEKQIAELKAEIARLKQENKEK